MLDQVCQLARNAGDAIMQVYDGTKPMDVVSKADNSPVTAADIAAHTVIMDGLRTLTPEIPVLSEEDPPGWEVRQHWQRYWLVDPLDGTKEFIKRNGEFTVNIALIDHGKPIFRCGVCAGNERNVQRGRRQGLERRVRCAQADSGPRCAPAAGGYQPFPCRCGAERVSATAWRTSDHVHRLFAEILPWWRKGRRSCTRASDQRIFGIPPLVMLWLQLPERTFMTGRVNRWITLRASRS